MNYLDPKIIDEALSRISYAWKDGRKNLVSIPLQYPSGSLCTLEVSLGRENVHVSDLRLGLFEAESLCEDTCYDKFAHQEAKGRGISYMNGLMFAREVSISQLPAALIAVGNASAMAATAAIRSDAARTEEVAKDELFFKVKAAFPTLTVHKKMDISGTNASWEVHNVVDLHDNRKAIFEVVKSNTISIATKFTMFSDLLTRGDLSLNAVVQDARRMDGKGQMLSAVATIVDASSSPDRIRELVTLL